MSLYGTTPPWATSQWVDPPAPAASTAVPPAARTYIPPALTDAQTALRDRVCAKARTLNDRLVRLADIVWRDQAIPPMDVGPVREWLQAIHAGEAAARRHSTMDR